MDVLEANLYHLLPPAPTDERPRAISSHFDRIERSDALEKLKTDEEELEGIKELDPAAEVENHVLELLTDVANALPSLDLGMQNKILQALQAICEYVAAYSYWRPLETMGKYLVIIRQVVNHLAQTPGLFPSSEAHKEFFTTLHRHVRLAYCSLDIFKEFRAERNKIIEEWVKELPRDDGDIYTDKLHWRTWAHNTVPIGSEEMRKAIVRKSNFKLMSSFLPRGGCAIAERWRADVNDAVNEMLQSNDSIQVGSQLATVHGMYLSPDENGKNGLPQILRMETQPGGSDEITQTSSPTIFSTAEVVGGLDGFEPRALGTGPIVFRKITYMNISHMREAHKEREKMVEDMGYLW